MRKYLLLFCALLFSFALTAQKKHEIKIDGLGFLFGGAAIGYEYKVSEKSAFQADVQFFREDEFLKRVGLNNLESERITVNRSYLNVRFMWKRSVYKIGNEDVYTGVFVLGRYMMGESQSDIARFVNLFPNEEIFDGKDGFGFGIPLGVKFQLMEGSVVLEPEFNAAIFIPTSDQAQINRPFLEFFPRIYVGASF
ncbi:MAG: hypothetical protein AAF847_16475 [Bacteroidota bacterium]